MGSNNKLSWIFMIPFLWFVLGNHSSSFGQERGIIKGKVTDVKSGDRMPGVNVFIEGTTTGTATNVNGEYQINNVLPGTYTIVASFISYDPMKKEVTLSEGETVVLNFNMEQGALELGELTVQAGVLRTLKRKKESIQIIDELDYQTIAELPDFDMSEALDRLPGVYTQSNIGGNLTGTGGRGFTNTFTVVRGIPPNLNNVTVMGMPLVSTTGERAVALDVLPSNAAGRIEVVKAVTADLDHNVIGGSINIVPLTAFDRPKNYFNATVQSAGINQVGGLDTDDNPLQFNATASSLFGKNDNFGIALTANYEREEKATTLIQPDEWRDIGEEFNKPELMGVFLPEGTRLEQGISFFDRISGSTTFDFRPGERQDYTLVTTFSNTSNKDTDLQTEWNFSDNFDDLNPVRIDENTVRTSIGRNDKELDVDRQDESLLYTLAKSENRLTKNLTWENRIGYVYAKTDEIVREWQFTNDLSTKSIVSDIDITEEIPWGQPLDAALFNDPTTYELDVADISPSERDSELFNYQSDWILNTGLLGTDGFLKTGFSMRLTDVNLNSSNIENIDNPNDGKIITLADFGLAASPPNLIGHNIFPTVDPVASMNLLNSSPKLFVDDATPQDQIENDFNIDENIFSGYVMASSNIGRLKVTGGVRIEHTYTKALLQSFNEADNSQSVDPETNEFTDVLPSIHLQYNFTDQIQARLSFTKTIARADLAQLASSRSIDFDQADIIEPGLVRTGNISQGNPRLDPFESLNLDLRFEYFPTISSLFGFGFFYKSIDDPIFTQTVELQNFEVDGIRFQEVDLTQPLNAKDGNLLGVEAQIQQTFTFLPQPLDGLGISGNVTFLDSELNIPGRESEDLPFFQQPDLIVSLTPFFNYKDLSVKLNYSFTDEFVSRFEDRPENDRFFDESSQLDFQASYKLLDKYTLIFSAKNLNEDSFRIFQGDPSFTWQREEKGKEFWFGIRARL